MERLNSNWIEVVFKYIFHFLYHNNKQLTYKVSL